MPDSSPQFLQSMWNNNVGSEVYHKFKWEIPEHYADIF